MAKKNKIEQRDQGEVKETKVKRRAQGLFSLLKFSVSLAGFGLIFGFAYFLITVLRAAPPDPVPRADGIVVLTGAGGGRLEAGAMLLRQGKAERLLISGVHPNVPGEDIRAILDLPEAQFECCVDLDTAALNTVGNAEETANWAQALGFEHLILVTSDYHMPRARLEVSHATGGMRITPYPVPVKSDIPFYKDKERALAVMKEYGKLLVIYVRQMGEKPQRPPAPFPAPTDVMRGAQDPPKITGPVSVPEIEPVMSPELSDDAKPMDKPQ